MGNFELLRLLAQGGMADIYLARHLGGQLERYVAVKVLNRQRANDPEACALFLDEARLLAMLNHHSLATVFEVDVESGVHYLAMEYVHGVDLRELLAAAQGAEAAIPYEVALGVVAAAAAGLDHAHRRCDAEGRPMHLVHRDVSLSNIMIGHDGAVKVVDFGIATATVSTHSTNPGIVRGKASYMSPEQCVGDPVDLRTDVFALGVVLYELTTGRRCFVGNSDFERMLAVVRGEYVRPTQAVEGYPLELEQVVCTALALDPAERYSSAAQLIEALERVMAGRGWTGGARAITRFMHELFGEVLEPWAGTPTARHDTDVLAVADEDVLDAVQLPQPDPTIVITKPRRLARGTEAEPVASEWQEDEPTRGRRSAVRLRARTAGDALAA
ncbi:MAG: serine/threonine protein kinase [Acidobacteriota bacterium]